MVFEFLDFGSLSNRRHYCDEELRLNKRLAPQLYLDVVPITGSIDTPHMDGQGKPLEFAVKMVQFPCHSLFDDLAARGELNDDLVHRLALRIAQCHAQAPLAEPSTAFANSTLLSNQVKANFDTLGSPAVSNLAPTALRELQRWSARSLVDLGPAFRQRKREGFIRECHGDLHLANIALVDGEPVAFDCIEFDQNLRWIDVIIDVAFVLMDLKNHGLEELSALFLNSYLDVTGDYESLGLLSHYQVYRALVRAKVAALRLLTESSSVPGEQAIAREQVLAYLHLAERLTTPASPPSLIITYGLSGSGKSWLSQQLSQRVGAVLVRSDVERKRRARTAPDERALYTDNAVTLNYQRLESIANTVLRSGYPVIVDATFLQQEHRDKLATLASNQRVPFRILHTTAPASVLSSRIQKRSAAGTDVSDATLQVLDDQRRYAQTLNRTELKVTREVDTSNVMEWEPLLTWLQAGKRTPGKSATK